MKFKYLGISSLVIGLLLTGCSHEDDSKNKEDHHKQ